MFAGRQISEKSDVSSFCSQGHNDGLSVLLVHYEPLLMRHFAECRKYGGTRGRQTSKPMTSSCSKLSSEERAQVWHLSLRSKHLSPELSTRHRSQEEQPMLLPSQRLKYPCETQGRVGTARQNAEKL